MKRLASKSYVLAFALPFVLAGCGWNGSDSPPSTTYSIGGTIAGLDSNGLVLTNGANSTSPVAGAATFAFAAALVQGGSYTVTVATQPAGSTCSIVNGDGMVGSLPVSNVQVNCLPNAYTVGGSIGGLASAGLVLANGADTVSPAAGALGFTFGQTAASGATYAVTVTTQPVNAVCSVSQGAGTVVAASVTTVLVTCAPNAYRIGGTVSGLASSGLVLANGTDTLSPPAGALTFTFANAVAQGGSYAVTVKTQLSGTTCSVGSGSGTVGGADVTDVQVTCSPNSYSVGGTISGLTAAGLILANGADAVSPAANATSFVFANKVAFGGSYSVLVQQQPAGQSCAVVGTFPATIGAGDVTNVAVTCSVATAFTLLAGSENCSTGGGIADGTGAAASVPSLSMTRDSAGNVYVLDDGQDTVRKVTPAGVVTTIAGQVNHDGNLDGTGAAALLYQPNGIAADSTGNVYVTESNDVRKVTPAGVVTTVAGGGGSNGGFADGTGAAARFLIPYGIAFDSAGNAFVADSGNSVIRKVTPGGVVTTLAGGGSAGGTDAGFVDGTGTAAEFRQPWGVAVDTAGNVFVADRSNHAIRKITPGGIVTTLAGGASGFADGTGAAALFIHPSSLALDAAGNLYVIDQDYQAIRIVSPTGAVTTLGISKNYFEYGVSTVPSAGVQFPIQLQGGIATNPSGGPYIGLGCAIEKIGP